MADQHPEHGEAPGQPTATNPQNLRALAHPLRWKLIDLLGTEGTATATRCSQALSESVASCSYHLHILAKYGYIEQAPDRRGREKPWRLRQPEQSLPTSGLDAEGAHAARSAMAVFLDHETRRLKDRLRDAETEPEGWQPFVSGMTVMMTEREYQELRGQIFEIFEQHVARTHESSARSADSREVRLFGALTAAPRGEAPGHRSDCRETGGEPPGPPPAPPTPT